MEGVGQLSLTERWLALGLLVERAALVFGYHSKISSSTPLAGSLAFRRGVLYR